MKTSNFQLPTSWVERFPAFSAISREFSLAIAKCVKNGYKSRFRREKKNNKIHTLITHPFEKSSVTIFLMKSFYNSSQRNGYNLFTVKKIPYFSVEIFSTFNIEISEKEERTRINSPKKCYKNWIIWTEWFSFRSRSHQYDLWI